MMLDGGDNDIVEQLSGWGKSLGKQEHELVELAKGPMRYTDDMIIMPLPAGTQWNGLAHVYYDDLLHNGRPASPVCQGELAGQT